MKKKRLT